MRRFWVILVATVTGAVLAIYHYLRGDVARAHAAEADALEKTARVTIEKEANRLATLKLDAQAHQTEITALELKLDEFREATREKFVRRGLSPEEIQERFRRIRL